METLEFKTKHNLPFEAAPWEPLLGFDPSGEFMRFRIGTCEGLWSCDETHYKILAVDNTVPGNGHLDDVFQWFEHSCIRDKKHLLVMEIMNKPFKQHLIMKRGFKAYGLDHVTKSYKQMKEVKS